MAAFFPPLPLRGEGAGVGTKCELSDDVARTNLV